MNLFAVLTRLDGRINRKPFWIGILVLTAFVILGIVAIMALLGEDALDGPYSGSSAITLAFGILTLIVSIPLMLKRLHDLNRSIRLLVPVFVMEALAIAGDLSGLTGNASDLNALGWALAAVYGVYALALFIYLGFYRGIHGPNDFGADPLAGEEIPATINL